MKALRTVLAVSILIIPPAIVALVVHRLYGLGWGMSAVIFVLLFALWAEGIRALQRID